MTAPSPLLKTVLLRLEALKISLRTDGPRLLARPRQRIDENTAAMIAMHRDALWRHVAEREQRDRRSAAESYTRAVSGRRSAGPRAKPAAPTGNPSPFDDDISDLRAT